MRVGRHEVTISNPDKLFFPDRGVTKGDLVAYTVMEKRAGWGTEYAEDIRNGEWEYARFRGDGSRDPQANIKGCFECHKPESHRDFVFTLDDLVKAAAKLTGR